MKKNKFKFRLGKYVEPNRLDVPDRHSRRHVLILNTPGFKSGMSDDDYLFVCYGDTPASRKPRSGRRHPERGVIIPFDKFFSAMKKLVDDEVDEWLKGADGYMVFKKKARKK